MEGSDGISVVVTVRNDRAGLESLLHSLEEQSLLPGELVVVDAGSTDGTGVLLSNSALPFPVRVIDAPRANISVGRNIGIEAATNGWVATTDAGCRPVPGWLAAIDRARASADFVAGIYVVDPVTPFEQAVAVSLYPTPNEIDNPSFFVRASHRLFGRRYDVARTSGRSMAFSKATWYEAGGFPAHLYTGEDVALSTAIVERGFRTVLVKEAAVLWRPRATWRATARMLRTYARGDVRSVAQRRQLLRTVVYALAPVAFILNRRRTRLVIAAGVGANLALPLTRAHSAGLEYRHWWRIPLLVVMKDLMQILGAADGVLDEARGRPQPHSERF